MSWKDEPATEIQISRLRQLGCLPEHPLTKGEAAHLISQHDTTFVSAPHSSAPAYAAAASYARSESSRAAAGTVTATSENYPQKSSGPRVAAAPLDRHRFWMETCCEPAQMHNRSPEVLDLHIKHGCQYVCPTREQTQEILDALDSALPAWEKEHPELFYQTLELNFPELRRHI